MKKEEYANMLSMDQTHWWFLGMTEIMMRVLNRFYGDSTNLQVLDAGCGTCWFSKALMRYGIVTALDIEPSVIPICKERGIPHVVEADVMNIPLPDNSFDLIVCSEVLYHRYVPADAPVMKEMYRLLKPGGRLLVKVPAHAYLWGVHDEVNLTRHRYERREVKDLFLKTGYQIEYITYANFFLFPIVFIKRYLERVFSVASSSDIKEVSPFVNTVLLFILRMEGFLVSIGRLPQGSSLICVGRRHL